MKKETGKTFGIFIVLTFLVLTVYSRAGCFDKKTVEVFETEKPEVQEKVVIIQESNSAKNIFEKYEDKAKNILKSMTLEEKVGQMFLVACPDENQLSLIKDYAPGGFLLCSKDFENKVKQRVIGDIKSYQYTSRIPMFMAVDEEGGKVTRVSKYKAFRRYPFLAPQDIFKADGFRGIEMDTAEKSKLLKSIGINLNLAPVADVVTDQEAYMYNRSFGMDARSTADYVRCVLEVMQSSNMGSTLKHFPGYGNNLDTHSKIVKDKRSFEEIEKNDLLPFREGINMGAASIMVSHNIVCCIDKEFPASLSVEVHKLLRNNLEFTGVIMTDCLSMKGAETLKNDKEIVKQAVKAGNDMLIVKNYKEQIPTIIDAVKNGEIDEEVIDRAVLRILSWKLMLKVISA